MGYGIRVVLVMNRKGGSGKSTLWYTPNKRRAKKALVLSELTQA